MIAITDERLTALEKKHAAALEAGRRDVAGKWRYRARVHAKAQGLGVPAWAVEAPSQKRKPSATPTPTPPGALEAEPAQPIELPAALVAWRSAGVARCVNVRRDGSVRLITFTASGVRQEAAFSDARTAERALLLGVSWRAAPGKKDTRERTVGGKVRLAPLASRSA